MLGSDGQHSAEAIGFFETLLDSGNDKERVRSIYYLSKTRTTEELESVLAANLQKKSTTITWSHGWTDCCIRPSP